MITREQLAAEYLDYTNNYLTVEKFAEHRGLHLNEALDFINVCRMAYYTQHPEE